MAIDEDALMAELGDINAKLSEISSDVDSIRRNMPDSPDNSNLEHKLDEIIKILKMIQFNQK